MKRNATIATVAIVFVLAVLLLVIAITPVKFGTVRAVRQFGGLTGTVFTEGLNWKVPILQSTVRYPVTVQSYETSDEPGQSKANYTDFPVTAQTTDGQQIVIKYTVLFRLPSENIIAVARSIGTMSDIVENVVKAHSRNLTRVDAQAFEAESLYSGSGVLAYQTKVSEALSSSLEANGIALVDFLVRKIEFDADYIQAIENQQIAQENIKTAGFNADAAEFEKQQSIRRGEAEKQNAILAAEAEAEATRLNADAEAYSIEVRGQALEQNPSLVQWEFVRQLKNIQWMILPDNGVTPLLPIQASGTLETR